MTRQRKFSILFCLFFIFTLSPFFANTYKDEVMGFTLDMPEGYEVIDASSDGKSYHFLHPNIPVNLIIKLSEEKSISTPQDSLQFNLDKLKASCQIDSFNWSGKQVAISTFEMTVGEQFSGWAVCTPTLKKGCYLNLLCYAPSDKEPACEQFIMSTLNSLCIDQMNYCAPGIIVSYAFPKEGDKPVELNIAGKSIKTKLDLCDEEASQFIVDMEYGVLALYGKHPMWKEAWQRYYRMIYRDSFGRLENVSADVFEALYPDAKKQNPKNTRIAYAQMLLSWVQNFNYKRADDPKAADFTALPCVLTGTGNDCDSRSLLICTLLKSIGTECLLLVSPEYSHAMIAAGIEAPGQQYELEGTDLQFIMGETTAKVTWGTIAQDHADRTKWFPVILP